MRKFPEDFPVDTRGQMHKYLCINDVRVRDRVRVRHCPGVRATLLQMHGRSPGEIVLNAVPEGF